MANTLDLLGGFTQGLAASWMAKSQQRQAKELEGKKNALAAIDYLMRSGRVADYSDLSPFFDMVFGGEGAGAKKVGSGKSAGAQAKAGGPQALLQSILDPALKGAKQGQPLLPGPAGQFSGTPQPSTGGESGTPPAPGNLPSRQVSAPGASVAQASTAAAGTGPMGVRMLSDEQMAARQRDLERQKAEGDRQNMLEAVRGLREQDPSLSFQDAYEMVATGRVSVPHQTAPKPLGKPVDINEVPEADRKDPNGNPVSSPFVQPIAISDGKGGYRVAYEPAQAPTVTRAGEHLTGDAKQLYDARLMASGMDPRTGKPVEDPAERARMIEVGKQVLNDHKLKNQATVVRVQTGTAQQDDIKELAPSVATGELLPSQIGSMGGAGKIRLMAAANRLRKDQGLPALDFRRMELEYRNAQRQIASLQGPQQIRMAQLGTTVVNTINEVDRLSQELKQGNIQAWNAAKRSTLLKAYSNSPLSETAARYLAAVNTLKEEFAGLAQGGYAPTESAWKLSNDQINTDYGVRDMTASLSEVQRLINYRLNARDEMIENVIGPAGAGGTGAGSEDAAYREYLKRNAGKGGQ